MITVVRGKADEVSTMIETNQEDQIVFPSETGTSPFEKALSKTPFLLAQITKAQKSDEKKTPYEAPDPTRFNFVFIMGTDGFYKEGNRFATVYYSGTHEVVRAQSLCDLLIRISRRVEFRVSDDKRDKIGQVVIISHADEQGRLYFPMEENGAKWVAPDDIGKIQSKDWVGKIGISCKSAALFVGRDGSDNRTRVIIRGCQLGKSQAALDALRDLFGGQALVTAPKVRTWLGRVDLGPNMTKRRKRIWIVSWMVKNGYLPPEAENWSDDEKVKFVRPLTPSEQISLVPGEFLSVRGKAVYPSNPLYDQYIGTSKAQ
ncbi:MAG: hypothetical protein ACE5IQ_00875 [Candidatus Methylomirabilales bacterium]